MRQTTHKNILIVTLTACLLMLVVGMLLPITPTVAQGNRPQRTVVPPVAGEDGGRIQLTPAGPFPPDREIPDFAATIEALTALSSLNPEALQATAQAVINNVPALEGEFSSEDFSAWIEELLTMGSISFDSDTGALTFTAQLDETTINTMIDEALTAAGYEASSVSIDFVKEYIVVTATEISVTDQISGTVVTTVGLSVVNGEVVADIIGATVNGQLMPNALVEEWEVAIQAAFSAMPVETPFEYSIDQISITDSSILITATIVLPVGE